MNLSVYTDMKRSKNVVQDSARQRAPERVVSERGHVRDQGDVEGRQTRVWRVLPDLLAAGCRADVRQPVGVCAVGG